MAIKLTGHKTESVYRRYEIVSEADLTEGVQKIAGFGHDELQSHSAEKAQKKELRLISQMRQHIIPSLRGSERVPGGLPGLQILGAARTTS